MNMTSVRFDYLDAEQLDAGTMALLGTLPKRWGRMDRLSRLAVVEVGRVLADAGLLYTSDGRCNKQPVLAGLVAATRRGSLATDLAYAKSYAQQGAAMASPLLFSYTLANIALSEAASHFGLRGPVYALYSDDPLSEARREADRWLKTDPALTFMVAGEIDCHGGGDTEVIAADFIILSKH